jgi:hypothetical protein
MSHEADWRAGFQIAQSRRYIGRMRVVSIIALVAAGFGAFIAFVTFTVLCFSESGGSTMCPDGSPTATMTAQLVVGLAGLIPPGLMTLFAFKDATRPALRALAAGLLLWGVWAFLNDAAVHGWGPGMRLL